MGCCTSGDGLYFETFDSRMSMEFLPPIIIIKPELFVQQVTGKVSEKYLLGTQIGAGDFHLGGFATVYEATHLLTGAKRALKQIQRANLPGFSLDSILGEVQLLRCLDHPNVLKVFEAVLEPETVNIVTELMRGGTLLDKVTTHGALSESEASHYFRQLISAVVYCHNNCIIHRDIKLENIVLETTNSDSIVKLIDFGDAVRSRKEEILTEAVGTVSITNRLFT